MTQVVAKLHDLLELQEKCDNSADSSGTAGFTWKIHKYFAYASKRISDQGDISLPKSAENKITQCSPSTNRDGGNDGKMGCTSLPNIAKNNMNHCSSSTYRDGSYDGKMGRTSLRKNAKNNMTQCSSSTNRNSSKLGRTSLQKSIKHHTTKCSSTNIIGGDDGKMGRTKEKTSNLSFQRYRPSQKNNTIVIAFQNPNQQNSLVIGPVRGRKQNPDPATETDIHVVKYPIPIGGVRILVYEEVKICALCTSWHVGDNGKTQMEASEDSGEVLNNGLRAIT
ncbi:concanavalin A-like lectin/glucanase [Tanacetum coccineum]